MKEFGALTAKTYSCLTANNNEDKKAKGTKSAQQIKLRFEDYKHFLEVIQLENKIDQSEKKTKFDVTRLKKNTIKNSQQTKN